MSVYQIGAIANSLPAGPRIGSPHSHYQSVAQPDEPTVRGEVHKIFDREPVQITGIAGIYDGPVALVIPDLVIDPDHCRFEVGIDAVDYGWHWT